MGQTHRHQTFPTRSPPIHDHHRRRERRTRPGAHGNGTLELHRHAQALHPHFPPRVLPPIPANVQTQLEYLGTLASQARYRGFESHHPLIPILLLRCCDRLDNRWVIHRIRFASSCSHALTWEHVFISRLIPHQTHYTLNKHH